MKDNAVPHTLADTVPPLCSCHQEPMYPRYDRPGKWRCTIKYRAARRRYRQSDKGRTVRAAAASKYRASLAGGFASLRRAQKRWAEQIQRTEAQLAAFGLRDRHHRRDHGRPGRLDKQAALLMANAKRSNSDPREIALGSARAA